MACLLLPVGGERTSPRQHFTLSGHHLRHGWSPRSWGNGHKHKSLEQSPSWEVNSRSVSQKIPSLWTTKALYRVHNSPPLVSVLSLLNPVHTHVSFRSDLILSLPFSPYTPFLLHESLCTGRRSIFIFLVLLDSLFWFVKSFRLRVHHAIVLSLV
jgi:hypothetical protein